MKTIEQKAKAYDEALEKARQLCGYPTTKPFISDLQDLFPELKENEDELEWLTQFIQEEAYILSMDIRDDEDSFRLKKLQRSLEWLEKQGEQKSTDTCNSSTINSKEFSASKKRNFGYFIKPKFHEGDWVVDNKSGITQQVLDFRGRIYTCTYNSFTIDCESNYHLWTIKDAKDGDVLQLGTVTAIFKKYIGQEQCICYCSIDEDGVFEIPIEDGENNIYGCTNTTPATKEQRALLFTKMEEAGYEYNLNKKELKNVDQKHIIEMKSPEESLGISSKEYNEIVNDCIYGESAPADKVEPKFKVKYAGSEYNVLEVKDITGVTYYGIEDEPNHIDYVQAKNCERVGGYNIKESEFPFPIKPTEWSEEDKERIKRIASFMWKNRKGDTGEIFQQEQDVKWLNSLIGENS